MQFDHTQELLHLTLGITQERFEEMVKGFSRANWLLDNPDSNENDEGYLLQKFTEVGQTIPEKILAAYFAGKISCETYEQEDIILGDEFEDWE